MDFSYYVWNTELPNNTGQLLGKVQMSLLPFLYTGTSGVAQASHENDTHKHFPDLFHQGYKSKVLSGEKNLIKKSVFVLFQSRPV
jgi:hypothetical protein